MRKLNISLLFVLLVVGSAMGQQASKLGTLYQAVPKDVPQEVLKAIERNNTGLQFQEKIPVALTREVPSMAPEKQLKGKSYEVVVKGRSLDGKCHSVKNALYDEQGNIVYSKTSLVNNALPVVVLRTIGKAYDGWLLVSTRAFIEEKKGERTAYYKVVLKKGKDKERVLLNGAGQIVKNKKDQQVRAMESASALK